MDLELQQGLGAIGATGIGGTGSASLPSGCAKSFARTSPQNQHLGAQDALTRPAARAWVCAKKLRPPPPQKPAFRPQTPPPPPPPPGRAPPPSPLLPPPPRKR